MCMCECIGVYVHHACVNTYIRMYVCLFHVYAHTYALYMCAYVLCVIVVSCLGVLQQP